jgi:hypothetical protein
MSSPFKFLKRFFFDQFMLGVDSGGGGGPTSSTVTQSNIPDWLRPQVEGLLGGATKQFFNTKEIPGAIDEATGKAGPSTYEIVGSKPFTPYSTDPSKYVAGFSPLQEQVQYNAANLMMPGQFNEATGFANAAGQGGMQSAQQALGYGNAGFQSGQLGQQLGMQGGQQYGQMGAQYGAQGAGYGSQAADIGQMGLRAEQYGRNISGQAEDYASEAARAGSDYAKAASNVYNPITGRYDTSNAISAYMSPYMQNVVDVQNEQAQRQADIAGTYRGAQAARAGAFGGARQAIENAEAQRNLATLKNQNQATGQQQAYQQALQNMQFGSNLGLQGLSGAQQGLGTALQGGQLGLSGIGTALQGLQGGMQGSGLGIQGAQAGLAGVDRQLAGTGQGMQGAGMGLQGVQGAQAGYGLANTAASNLANIGSQQLGAQTGILSLQNQVGGQQQAQEQRIIDNAINNYAQAQNAPLQNFNNYNALLRGYAVPGQTSTQYSAAPSFASQVVGGGTALLAGNQLLKSKAGGHVKRNVQRADGLDSLAMYKTMRGAS